MTDAMKRFLELDRLMENEIKARMLDKTKIECEMKQQRDGLWDKMRRDLIELSRAASNSGVDYDGECIKTGVSIHMQKFPLNANEESTLGFSWNGNVGMLSECIWRKGSPLSYNRYAVCNTNAQAPSAQTVLTLYGRWDEIMRGAEQGLMRKIIDKRREQTAALENEIEKLGKIKMELEDLE